MSRPTQPSVASLTGRIARGDREALGAFYEAWFDRSCAMARAMTRRDEAFCLDVVQDAMIRVARSMERIDTEAQLARWMTRTIHAAAIDRLRAEARRITREQKCAIADRASGDPDEGVLDERMRLVREQLAQLDADERALLHLHCVHDCTRDQIARATGLTPGAVHGRVRRLLARLRARMAEEHTNA